MDLNDYVLLVRGRFSASHSGHSCTIHIRTSTRSTPAKSKKGAVQKTFIEAFQEPVSMILRDVPVG